eukprot:gene19022-22742_t
MRGLLSGTLSSGTGHGLLVLHYSNSGSDGSDSDDASEASEDGVSEAGSDIPPSLASDTDSDDSDLDFSSVVDTGEEA